MIKNNTIILLAFLLSFGQLVCQTNKTYIEETTTLKVLSYNIWNGFDWGKDEERREKLTSWIYSKKPDVVALQELCAYTEEKLLEDAKKWGHDYAIILKNDGYPVGLTSSKPIHLKERARENLWHGMLHCETWGIDFFVVHLSPADRDFRYREAQIIKGKVENIENENYIVLGDFNAHSPFDGDQDLSNTSLLEKIRMSDDKKENQNNLLDRQFDYSVIASFLALPLIDVVRRYVEPEDRFTFPARALIGIWQTAEEIEKNKHRIDYILASRALAKTCTNAFVFNKEETGLLSDHYPVMAEFRLHNRK
jgi:endonuclease/exonuclease/phosphatase family metal-dependent hydrolase